MHTNKRNRKHLIEDSYYLFITYQQGLPVTNSDTQFVVCQTYV